MSDLLSRFNHYMNLEFMSSSYGTAVSIEELESMSLRAMLYSIVGSENPDADSEIKVFDIITLIEELDHQGKKSIKKEEVSYEI